MNPHGIKYTPDTSAKDRELAEKIAKSICDEVISGRRLCKTYDQGLALMTALIQPHISAHTASAVAAAVDAECAALKAELARAKGALEQARPLVTSLGFPRVIDGISGMGDGQRHTWQDVLKTIDSAIGAALPAPPAVSGECLPVAKG